MHSYNELQAFYIPPFPPHFPSSPADTLFLLKEPLPTFMSSFGCGLMRSYLVGHRQLIHLRTRWHLFTNNSQLPMVPLGEVGPHEPPHSQWNVEGVQACADNHILSEFVRARIMSCPENIFRHASRHPPLLHSFCPSSVIFPTPWRDTTAGAELHQHSSQLLTAVDFSDGRWA